MSAKKFYGWPTVVVIAFLFGLLGNFGLAAAQIAIPAMATDPNVTMDRTMISLGFTVFVFMQGLPGPIIGQIVAKKGARFAFLASSVCIVATGILMGLFCGVSTAAYIVLFGIVLSFSSTLGGQVATQTTIGNWFVRKRGLAMSVTMGLGGVLGFAYPLMTNAAVNAGGWSWGFYLISAVAIVAFVIALLFLKNQPSDIGQEPDGGITEPAPEEDKAHSAHAAKVYKNSEGLTQSQSMRKPAFWLILISTLAIFCALNLTVSAGVLHFTSLGLDSTTVALAVSFQGIAAIAVNLIVAPLADRIEPARLLALCSLLAAACMACAVFGGGSVAVLFAYYLLMGLAYGGNSALMPTAFANYFGMEHFSKLIGTVLLLLSLLSGLIPLAAGMAFDATGSYAALFTFVMVLGIVGSFTGFLVKYPKQ